MESNPTVLWLNSPESPGPRMITLQSLDDDEDHANGNGLECVEDHPLGVNYESCDSRRHSLTPDSAQKVGSDSESLRSQETSDSECSNVPCTEGK